jgi:hypothetical protein
VSQEEVGLKLFKAPGTIVLFKLNEHGAALKVFWIRRTPDWARGREAEEGKKAKTAFNRRKEKLSDRART